MAKNTNTKKRYLATWVVTAIIVVAILWSLVYQKNQWSTVKQGDIVDVYYTIQDQAKNIIQTNSGSQAIQVIAGQNSSIPYVEKMVIGMKYGQTQTQTVKAEDAYGKFYDPNKLQVVSKKVFDSIGIDPEVGQQYILGDTVVIVRDIAEDTVTIDLNPAFTKEDAVYTITVLEENK